MSRPRRRISLGEAIPGIGYREGSVGVRRDLDPMGRPPGPNNCTSAIHPGRIAAALVSGTSANTRRKLIEHEQQPMSPALRVQFFGEAVTGTAWSGPRFFALQLSDGARSERGKRTRPADPELAGSTLPSAPRRGRRLQATCKRVLRKRVPTCEPEAANGAFPLFTPRQRPAARAKAGQLQAIRPEVRKSPPILGLGGGGRTLLQPVSRQNSLLAGN